MSKLTHTQIGHLADHIATVMAACKFDTTSTSVSAIEDLPEMEPWEAHLSDLVRADPILPVYAELGAKHSDVLEFLIDYYTPEV